MTKTRVLRCALRGTVILLLVSVRCVSQAQPAGGDWKAPTTFGELAFTVNAEGSKVTKLVRDVRNWSCGPVSGSWTTTTSWTDPQAGWPISSSQFTITLNGTIGSLATVWIVSGTFGGTGKEASGTWSFSISGTTCSGNWGPVGPATFVESGSELPAQYALEQNFPNPFNPVTTIRFSLLSSHFTVLRVFDLLGREVSTLVNERKEAGVHQVKFDARGLPSGVYSYRLHAGDFVQTRKMLLLQ
jgi:Secretion system C-terminal sorting domain